MHCGPGGLAAGAKRPHAAEGREGEHSEAVVPEATHWTYKMARSNPEDGLVRPGWAWAGLARPEALAWQELPSSWRHKGQLQGTQGLESVGDEKTLRDSKVWNPPWPLPWEALAMGRLRT